MARPLDKDDAMLSSKQVAELMGVSLVTLSRSRSEGKGRPFVCLSATKAAYPVRACRAWLEAQTMS